jgi:N,N'-diacetyllegionaminate synthase
MTDCELHKRVYIIAEAGVNHNGSVELAKQLIDKAAESGADAVKFQTFKAENVVSQTAPKANYQKQNSSDDESQYQMIKKLELDVAAHQELFQYTSRHGLQFLSTPFDHDSIDLLAVLGVPLLKIPSGEITNLPYLRHIARIGKPVIMSTGMACLGEIEEAMSVLLDGGIDYPHITLLHCNTEYPTPLSDVNLKAMLTISRAFPGIRVGYSDHTHGIEVPIAAVAMGARVIEKHFTLDKALKGPDHQASLDPIELSSMVQAIRNIEQAIGSGIKKPSSSETKNITIARRSIVACRPIKKGQEFTEDNITTKRPGVGISPMRWDEIIGRNACRDFLADELIEI